MDEINRISALPKQNAPGVQRAYRRMSAPKGRGKCWYVAARGIGSRPLPPAIVNDVYINKKNYYKNNDKVSNEVVKR